MSAPRKKQKRKTLWVRRIVSTLILLGILALIVFLLVKAVTWIGGVFQSGRQTVAEQTTPRPVVIEECLPSALTVTLVPEKSVALEGAGVNISMTVENTGDVDCKISEAQIGLQLTGQEHVLWNPGSCSEAMQNKMLLLAPGQPWSTTVVWDGQAHSGCDAGQSGPGPVVLGEGTYQLEARVLGGEARGSAPLVIQ